MTRRQLDQAQRRSPPPDGPWRPQRLKPRERAPDSSLRERLITQQGLDLTPGAIGAMGLLLDQGLPVIPHPATGG